MTEITEDEAMILVDCRVETTISILKKYGFEMATAEFVHVALSDGSNRYFLRLISLR